MTRASRILIWVPGFLALATLPRLAAAQTRDQQITQAQAAYDAFDPPRALMLLRAAVDPTRGPQDATWAKGVQLLAQILVEDQKTPLATTWLRWAIRLSPTMPIDTVTYLPEVVTAARAARATVIGSADTVSRTTWQWAAPGFSDAEGGLRVSSRTGTPVQVLVEGTGLVTAGQAMRLPPGTYNMQASSNGFVTSRVSREVLPGTVTAIEFNLVSVVAAARAVADTLLAQPVLDATVRRVAMVQPERFGLDPAASCASGFVVGSGLIATSYRAIRGGDRVTIDLGAGRRVTDVRVAAYNIASDVAFLTVPTALTDSMPVGTTASAGPLYAVGFGDCRAAAARRTVVAQNSARPDALGSGTRLADGFRGAPLVDRAGTVLGVVAGPDSALAVSRVIPVLAEARRVVAARGTLSTPGEVATREKHSYGSMTVRSGVTGAVIRVRPLETWQWPELAREGPAPFTFAGPAGRYEVALVVGGTSRQTGTATVAAGTRGTMNLDPQVAGGTPVGGQTGLLPTKKKSKMPLIIAGGGAVAGGAVLFAVLGGGKPQVADTGSVHVLVPVNP